MDLVWKVRPPRTKAEIVEGLRAAMQARREERRDVRAGSAGRRRATSTPGRRSANAGELTVRVNYRPSLADWEKARDGARR